MDIDSDFETESPRMRSRASSDGSWTRVPAAPALTGPAVVPPAASAAASPRVSTTPAAAFTSTSGTGVEMDWRLLDLKGFLTPTPYSGREEDFPAWKEGFLNIMSALDLDAYMMEAEVRSVPPELAIMTPEQRKMAKMLHIILQKVTQDTGVAALVVKSVRDRNGFMAWRNLCAEIQPRIPDRQTSRRSSPACCSHNGALARSGRNVWLGSFRSPTMRRRPATGCRMPLRWRCCASGRRRRSGAT
mmetsp:Transcript_88064/g.158784  ORF Transcript_88064/g.158784 Transcript_88064/m.158784 type:complete len:245 (+) Transcript_88064:373-1107(+)